MTMPRWWGQLVSKLRRRRMVRVHLKGDAPSMEGFYRGIWAGHYVLEVAKMHEAVDRAVPLEGLVEIPRGNVLFLQTVTVVTS